MGLESAVEAANDKHLSPWLELLKQFSIEHTPLSPFIHIELLRQNHLSIGTILRSRCVSAMWCCAVAWFMVLFASDGCVQTAQPSKRLASDMRILRFAHASPAARVTVGNLT